MISLYKTRDDLFGTDVRYMMVVVWRWRSDDNGVMAFVDTDDSVQKTMGIDFGIPLHRICDAWLAHDGTWWYLKHVIELIFCSYLHFLAMPTFLHFSCLFVVPCGPRTHVHHSLFSLVIVHFVFHHDIDGFSLSCSVSDSYKRNARRGNPR